MSIVSESHPPRPYCLPGCNRLDGHDGRDSGACMGPGGEVLRPGPLDLVHQHPDIPVNVPVRNVVGTVLSRAVHDATAVAFPPFSPFLGIRPDKAPSRPRACYRLPSGAMVHVKPGCRC